MVALSAMRIPDVKQRTTDFSRIAVAGKYGAHTTSSEYHCDPISLLTTLIRGKGRRGCTNANSTHITQE